MRFMPGMRRRSHAPASAAANTTTSQQSAAPNAGSFSHRGRNSRFLLSAMSRSCNRYIPKAQPPSSVSSRPLRREPKMHRASQNSDSDALSHGKGGDHHQNCQKNCQIPFHWGSPPEFLNVFWFTGEIIIPSFQNCNPAK